MNGRKRWSKRGRAKVDILQKSVIKEDFVKINYTSQEL